MPTKNPIVFRKIFSQYILSDKEAPFVCAFSTRVDNFSLLGITNRSERELVIQARRKFFTAFDAQLEKAVFLEQPHRATVFKANRQDEGRGAFAWDASVPGADAVITAIPGLALAILTADCLPIVIADPLEKAVGIIHAGWRGIYAEIAKNTVSEMCREFNCRLKNLYAYIGPGIGKCCYEVQDDVADKFPGFILRNVNRVCLDLSGAVLNQLFDAGIKETNIYNTAFCTCCKSDEFFSYRRGDRLKRMITGVMIK
ncbi:MAG: peptidoglycan editing factor PgeF [Candidatus Omnitrophota bacterium]